MFHNAVLTVRRKGNPVDPVTGYRKKEKEARVIVEGVLCTFSQQGGSKRFTGGRKDGDHMKDVAKPEFGIIFDDFGYDEIRQGDIAVVKMLRTGAEEKEYTINSAEPGVGIASTKWFLAVDAPKMPIPS